MRFTLTEEQKSIQKAVREFTRGEFDEDMVLELLAKGDFPHGLLQKASSLDFIGVCYPESCGGQDCGPMEQVLIIEEFCRQDSSVGVALSMADAGAEIVCAWGDDNQRKRILPALARGKMVATVLFGDLDAGEDGCLGLVLTPGENGTRRLNGNSTFVLNAEQASVLIVQVQIAAEDGTPGCAFVLLDRKAPGVSIQSCGDKLGIGTISWCDVSFENVAVTEADIVRPAGKGHDGLLDFQKTHLVRSAAMNLGIAQGAFDMALRYAKQRVQFNRKIAAFQGIRHKLADMYIDLQATRAVVYAAAQTPDAADLHDLLAVKLKSEQTALFLTDEALQIFGGSGYMIELPVEHFYRDARTLQALTGRTIFQKDVIAQAVVGNLT